MATHIQEHISVSRTLNATRMQVWFACSNANILRYWWGLPKGATMPFIDLDFRVGGTLHFRAELENGEIVWGLATYKEIIPLQKIVIENHFSDEKRSLLDSKLRPASLITIVLEDDSMGTIVTVMQSDILGERSKEEILNDWSQSLERLALELVNQ